MYIYIYIKNYVSSPSQLHLSFKKLSTSTIECLCVNNVYGSHAHLFAYWPSRVCGSWNDLGEGVIILSTNMQSFLLANQLNQQISDI